MQELLTLCLDSGRAGLRPLISRSGLEALLVLPCAYTHSLQHGFKNLQVDLPEMSSDKLEE